MGILAMFMQTTILFSQDKSQVLLLDEETYFPLEGAYFEYGDQTGISTNEGMISFDLIEGQEMTLSHVSYGTWKLTGHEVMEMVKRGNYYRKSLEINLYPVTIIAVNPGQSPTEGITLQPSDWMAHDGATVLNQTPGFNSIRKSGNYGFDPVFRGFKYDQLNIVMNGAQSATAACPNRMDPPTSQMAPNMMDRIEVLKGPYALRYGTGFGGTVNFIPSALRFSEQADIYGRASTGYESNGNIFRNEGQVGVSGKTYDLSMFGSWSQGNDYKTGDGQTVKAGFNRGSFGSSLGLKLSSKQQLRVSTIYNRSRDADFPALPMDLRKDNTWMLNARHDIQINRGTLKSWNTTIYSSMVDHRMDNLLKDLNPRMMNASTDATTRNYGGRTESVWKFKMGTLFAGADYRVEAAKGIRTREFLMGPMAGKTAEDNAWQDGMISKSGLFGEYHINTDKYHVVLSGRMEVNHATINDPTAEFTAANGETTITQVNPNFSLGASRVINKSMKVGLWFGRAQRSGGLAERFINYFPIGQDPYELVGNPQIKAEVNNQTDLTFEWSNDKTALNVDVFGSYMQNFISSRIDTTLTPRLPNSPGVRRYVNIAEAYKTGFEISWTQKLVAGLQHQMGVAYTYAQDLTRNQPLPQIAPLDARYTLRGNYFEGKLKPSATLRHVLQQGRISPEYGETKTPAFTLVDVQVSYQVIGGLKLSTGVNNLFNVNYYEHLNRSVSGTANKIYAPGRNISASLNLTF